MAPAVPQGPPKMERVPTKIDATSIKPIHLAVYGDDGVGKTQLALTFPNPLVVNVDYGLTGGAVVGIEGEEWSPESYRDLNALYFWLKGQVEKHGYKTIVIDTINSLQWLLLHEAVSLATGKRAGGESDNVLTSAEQQDYNKTAAAFDKFLGKLKMLSQHTGVHIVLTSALREPDIEKGQTKRTFDVQPAIQKLVRNWADVYGELEVKELGKGDDKRLARVLHTNPADTRRRAKTRYDALYPGVVDPTFSKIRKLIADSVVTTEAPATPATTTKGK